MAVDVFISQDQIAEKVKELGQQISKDYAGEELTVVTVLNGSFMYAADLVRAIDVPQTLEFIAASSYGDNTESSGEVNITLDLKKPLTGKNVLVVEDIVDTGNTMDALLKYFKNQDPKSLKLTSLLYKPARNIKPVTIDYLGFEIEDKFVIGYGLDYAGKYRELPYIGVYSE